MTAPARPRVAILGGGFAGVYTALELEKRLGARDDFEILLVNKENYFVFQPMLPEVISGSIGVLDIISPLRRMLPRTDIHGCLTPGRMLLRHSLTYRMTCPSWTTEA